MRRTPLKYRRISLKSGGRLRVRGVSSISTIKRDIQALLRELAIKRDSGCVLRYYPEASSCGGYRKDGELILQAEHLNGRGNSVSFADMDNIVTLCRNHHFYFKKRQSALYWYLIQEHIGPVRWMKVQAWIRDKTPHRMTLGDWRMLKLLLERETQQK